MGSVKRLGLPAAKPTYGLFANATWSPTVYPAGELPDAWPVIVKPDCGQGGNGVALAHNDTQLTELSAAMDSQSWSNIYPVRTDGGLLY
jgi:carbamoylphosphate synthase large subunit